MENLHAIASNRSVIGFSYVAVCLLFSSLFLFRIMRIRRRRKVHVRYISSLMSFLYTYVVQQTSGVQAVSSGAAV